MIPVRADLLLVRHPQAPLDRGFIINDRVTNRYWNVGPVQFEMARIFAKHSHWASACAELRAQFEEPLTNEEISAAYESFRELGLLELTADALKDLPVRTYLRALGKLREHPLLAAYRSPAELLAPARAAGAEALIAAMHRALHLERVADDNAHVPAALRWMRVQVPLYDPNAQLERWMPRLRWLYSPWFFLLSLVVAIVGFSVYVDRAREVHQRLGYVSGNLALLFFCTVLMLVVHEYAHAFTCKYFGGEVREIGIIVFLFFIPAAYCDVSDAHLFSSRRAKLWTTFAGTWSTFLLASLGALLWSHTVPTATLNHVGLVLMASGYATVLTNLNPLLPLDGYFFLSDWLGIDNLRDRAPDYCKAYLAALFTGKPRPVESPRLQRIFFAYFFFGSAYQIFYLLLSIGFGWLILVRGGTLLGLVLYVALVYLFYVRNYVVKLRELWREARTKSLLAYALGMVGFVTLLAFVPLPVSVAVPAVVREAGRVHLVAPAASRIDQLPRDGAGVQEGETLFVFGGTKVRAPVAGTVVLARDWTRHAPVAAGEPLASVVTGYVVEGELPQRSVEDARRAWQAEASILGQTVAVFNTDVVTAKGKPMVRASIEQTAVPETAARLLIKSHRRTSLWRRLWGEQWDRVRLDVWRLL